MMLWGKVTQNKAVEDLGSLMLRLNARAVRPYFLMTSDNTIHPAQFVPNHVTGIFFDNKADYATWFSAEKYCIHGIQMIPVSPINGLVRTKTFIQEEWDDILSKEAIVTGDDTTNAWLSLLLVNQAVINQADALAKLSIAKMDDGLTRSWALYNAASRGGSGKSSSSTKVVTVAPSSTTKAPTVTKPTPTVTPTTTTEAPVTKTPTSTSLKTTPPVSSISQMEIATDAPATTPLPTGASSPTTATKPGATTPAPETSTGTHYPGWTSISPGWTSIPPGWTSIPPGWTSIPPGWTSYTPGVVEPAGASTETSASNDATQSVTQS
ncbi:unnamed protein product [Phytophthora lilii]|uniref:glucan endo-1,3-beta-D-glucosidase n=1 Tax=Phytophthora lilii TaxID=2077276 RepID=A0A9W6XFD9_9STRA|nr:unnamed protein product [Phytophthora lilii]